MHLGLTFANFHIGNLEQSVRTYQNIKPGIYCRHEDDIFVVVQNKNQLNQLKE